MFLREENLNKNTEKFDYWMKNYNHPQRPDTQHLVSWLYNDGGARHIKDYSNFCKLAILLNQKGYATNPPPEESEFNKGIEKYAERHMLRKSINQLEGGIFGKRDQAAQSAGKSTSKLAEQFDYWMKNSIHPQRPDTQHFICWLDDDDVAKHVKDYSKFCELAILLHQKGYAINLPSDESKFNKNMEPYAKLKSDKKSQRDETYYSVPPTKKPYLEKLQENFSPKVIDYQCTTSFGRKKGIFLYANDAAEIPAYYKKCYKDNLDEKLANLHGDFRFNLFDFSKQRSEKHQIGIVVGNGSILSLLPDIEVDDIILLDIEPALHYFVLSIRDFILQTQCDEDFDVTKNKIIYEINELVCRIKPSLMYDLKIELQLLGEKHFLSNKSRFEQCKKALESKELLPIQVNIFNQKKMSAFIDELKQAKCEVSYMNLTNMGDYDNSNSLCSVLCELPITKPCKILTTTLVGYSSKNYGNECYVSKTLDELKENLNYSYIRNSEPISTNWNLCRY